jgi:hypothetical protein
MSNATITNTTLTIGGNAINLDLSTATLDLSDTTRIKVVAANGDKLIIRDARGGAGFIAHYSVNDEATVVSAYAVVDSAFIDALCDLIP